MAGSARMCVRMRVHALRVVAYLRERHPRGLKGFHDTVFPFNLHNAMHNNDVPFTHRVQCSPITYKDLVCAWKQFAMRFFANN